MQQCCAVRRAFGEHNATYTIPDLLPWHHLQLRPFVL